MIKSISKNFRKPKGVIGSMLLNGMNKRHEKLTKWALSLVDIQPGSRVLDVGCGGGNAVSLMSQRSQSVCGVDYSEVSVKKSRRKNAYSISQGRVDIVHGNVSALPFPDGGFDLVTAFETLYFWPDPAHDFSEVYRVVKDGGCFMAVFQNGLDETQSRRLESSIPGMRIPSPAEVETLMQQANFLHSAVYSETFGGNWLNICVIAKK